MGLCFKYCYRRSKQLTLTPKVGERYFCGSGDIKFRSLKNLSTPEISRFLGIVYVSRIN